MSVKKGIAADNDWLSRCEDFEQSVLRYKSVRFSRFISPHDLAVFKTHFKPSPFVSVKVYGGAEDSERNIIGFFPDYMEPCHEDFPISRILISNVSQMSHRDILGSVLGLGIKREMTGDIYIDGDSAVIMCEESIADFLIYNLKTVGRKKVEVKKLSESSKMPIKHSFAIERRVVASLRLDAVISAATGMSRRESSETVESELVNVNFCIETDSSKKISEGDIISVRHYGRFVLEKVCGETRKGRQAVEIKKYI